MQLGARTPEGVFYEDTRAVWRVTWTLACGFLLVSGLMRAEGAALWPLFGGFAGLLLWVGASAVWRGARPLLGVLPEGLRIHAGEVGLGGLADASAYTIPWQALTSVSFEQRPAHRGRDGRDMLVTALCFGVSEDAPRPDGHRGFLEELSGRCGSQALGEHLVWNPEARKIDLLARPRGGYARLTEAIARFEPRLGDASSARREGLGGAFAYTVFDVVLAAVVLGTLLLLATDRMNVLVPLAGRVG